MKKNGDADSLLDVEPATVDDLGYHARWLAPRSATRPLKNWKHEQFAKLVVAGTEPREAYTLAGFAPNRANHNRLMRQVADRIEVLRRERETAARAARVPIDQILEEMDRRGLGPVFS